MEYPPCVEWYFNIQSETIKQWPTLLLWMEFWDFWWVSSLQDEKQCGLANCNECQNCIQTSSHSYTGIPFTLWLVLSDYVAVFWCAWRSRGWYGDGTASCRCIVFRSEEFDACYLDWRRRSSTGCGAPDDLDGQALDDKEVVRIDICQRKTTCPDTKGECTPHWYWVDRWRASKTEGPGGVIHFTWFFGSMESSLMATYMFFICVGRPGGSQRRFWTMVRWMGTRYLGRFANFPIAERDIPANACQRTCRVSRTWRRKPIKRGAPSGVKETPKCSPQCTPSTKSSAILSSAWPDSSIEVVANEVFSGSCGYILHVCRNGH